MSRRCERHGAVLLDVVVLLAPSALLVVGVVTLVDPDLAANEVKETSLYTAPSTSR